MLHTQPVQLQFPPSFKWEKQNSLPFKTESYYSSALDGKIYISAGNILEYTPDTDTWVEIPTPTKKHGMLSLNGKVTLVSGSMRDSEEHSREIYVWDREVEQWTKPYPLLSVAHTYPGCASYQHYLIVAGGCPRALEVTSTSSVEILDTNDRQWYKAPPMPYNGHYIQSVIIEQSLYLLLTAQGATLSRSILRVSLPTLISHTMQGKNRDSSIWEKLPDVPLYYTTLFSIGNMLLTAGGTRGGTTRAVLELLHLKSSKPSADIYLFNAHTNQWVKVSELPEARWSCICTVLPSGKLLVAGGSYGERNGQELSTVYTATIS